MTPTGGDIYWWMLQSSGRTLWCLLINGSGSSVDNPLTVNCSLFCLRSNYRTGERLCCRRPCQFTTHSKVLSIFSVWVTCTYVIRWTRLSPDFSYCKWYKKRLSFFVWMVFQLMPKLVLLHIIPRQVFSHSRQKRDGTLNNTHRKIMWKFEF